MSYATQIHHQSSSSGAGGLPSPPPSARSSIDITQSSSFLSRREQLPRSNSLRKSVQKLNDTSVPVSPPETVVGSPPKANPLVDFATILRQLQPVLSFDENECEITGVTLASFEALQAYMIASNEAGAWESLRIDLRPDKLIVRLPTIGHELMSSLFILMAKSGTGYPELYSGSRIVEGGCADVHYNSGYKSPDFSLYEVRDGGVSDDQDSSTPTIVFEVAYSQSTRSLVREAARHICLTRGQVQLVVTIDIVHKRGTSPRELESVTWSHWEEDVLSHDVVEDYDDELDQVSSERGDEENSEEFILPPATAYTAVVAQPGGQRRYRIRAEEMGKWQLFPDANADVETIDILHRHLYRDADEKDLETPVFSFTRSDIMTIIYKHESIQRKGDNKVIKRKLEQDLDAYAAIEARTDRQKRQRRARDALR